MSKRGVHAFASAGLSGSCQEEEDVVEIPLLLSQWHAEALENAAHQQGLTAGEMIRRLLLQYLARKADR